MEVFILLNLLNTRNPVLGVYDSELLAMKRENYYKNSFPEYELKIVSKNMEYIEMD